MGADEFIVVGLTRDEDRSGDFELRMLRAAGVVPTILVCDELDGPIVGFEQYSRVFFLNQAGWEACSKAGLGLRAMRTVSRREIPKKFILLAGPSSEAPSRWHDDDPE